MTLRTFLVGAHPRRTLARAVGIVVAAYVVFSHLLIPVRGEGPSMLPTLRDGQLVFVNTLAYWNAGPRRGDIVALSLAGRRVVYIKRIVGLPGERVRIDRGQVLVDERPLEEPYVALRRPWNIDDVVLDADEYLVIGDNRGMSAANHDFGKARRDRVIGRIVSW